jgi:hypothetical protein
MKEAARSRNRFTATVILCGLDVGRVPRFTTKEITRHFGCRFNRVFNPALTG